MRRIIIDAQDMPNKDSLHLVLKEALNLPDYYGRNLDALWDGLMETGPIELYLRNGETLKNLPEDYGVRLISLFEKAEEERGDFTFHQLGKRRSAFDVLP